MKLKILTATLCMSVMTYSGASLAATTSGESSSYSCQEIYDHYMNAVNLFLGVVNGLSKGSSVQKYTYFMDQLQTAQTTLNNADPTQNNYSHPMLVTLYSNIKSANKEIDKKHRADLSGLSSQMSSTKTQVESWQANGDKSCRTQYEADLGEQGTVAAYGCCLTTTSSKNHSCTPPSNFPDSCGNGQ